MDPKNDGNRTEKSTDGSSLKFLDAYEEYGDSLPNRIVPRE